VCTHFVLWCCGLLSRRRWSELALAFLQLGLHRVPQHSEFMCWLIPLVVSQTVVVSVGLTCGMFQFFRYRLTVSTVEA